MIRKRRLKYVPVALFAVVVTATAMIGCSAAKDLENASQGCDGLDVNVQAQLTVKSFTEAAINLKTRAKEVEARFLAVCNKMNTALGEDATKTTAQEACGILKARVDKAIAAGVTVDVQFAFNCRADVQAQASCDAQCNAKASCDVTAMCEPGKLVVACNGSCSAQCDVQAPDFQCTGMCEGACTANVTAMCTGNCEGSCDAPMFDGTCDVGCTASFVGSCDGMCMGMCNGTATMGACDGKCEGTCTGKATGTCAARCMGMFKGGRCMGMCSGSCTLNGSAMCTGKCNGKCSYTPGTATCTGECHGMCSAETQPPRCTGTLSCMASAECRGSCNAKASASVDCSKPQATVKVEGDLKLQNAIEANIGEWAEAFNMFIALKGPVAEFANKSAATFQALGEISTAGLTCVASGVAAAGDATLSVNVSVMASASIKASNM